MPYSRLAPRFLAPILIATLVLPGAAFAQDDAPSEVFELTLGDALRMALENNLQLMSASRDPAIAEQDVEITDANFDAGLEARANRTETTQVPTDATQFDAFNTTNGSVGVAQNLKFGANYTVGLGTVFREQSGGIFAASRFWSTGVNFDFTLPLLDGFGKEVATEQLILARNAVQVSRYDLSASAQQTLEQVEGAYWDVLAASAALRIARLSLTRAQDLLELNRKKVEVGTLAPIEITQAEAGVASQEEGVIVAEVNLQDAEDELRRLLAIPDGDPRWAQPIAILDRPDFQPRDVELDAAMEVALARRPELAAAKQRLENSELSERVARRNVRHQLDFTAGFDPSGISPDEFEAQPNPNPPPPAINVRTATANFADSFTRIADLENYSWNVGLVYRVPFGNHADKARYARASLSREKTAIAVDDQEQTVRVEVRRAVRAVESGSKRVDAARVNVELQQKKLEAEQKKFENGMSTSFEVLTFQNDLADAELSEIRARLDYIKSLAALERAKGTLLEARGLSLD